MSTFDAETLALLKLSMCEGIGNEAVHRLVGHFGSALNVMQADRRDLRNIDGVGTTLASRITNGPDRQRLEEEIDLMERANTRLLRFNGDDYPLPLSHIGTAAPPLLRIRGDYQRRDMLSAAIVGSRQCTHYGRSQARRFGMALSGYGFTIISGLARGIDTEAHRAALQSNGRTLALLGCGLARIDTLEDPEMALGISENGGLMSELPMKAPPLPRHFPPRNRLISGLSLGVLVVQAGEKSGTLITARWAGEQGKGVFAIPGQVNSHVSHGCHELIRDGATLVENPREILAELGPMSEPLPASTEADSSGSTEQTGPHTHLDLNVQEQKVFDILSVTPQQMDDIIHETGMSASIVSSILLTLEIRGIVDQLPGQRYIVADN